MKKLLLLPAMLFPYSFVLGFIFSEGYAGGDSAMVALAVFVGVFLILPFACNIAFIILSRKDEPYKLIQSALIVKLVHIPSYVIIFVMGLISSLMIFMTLPLIIMFILFDYMVLITSSFISVFALAKNIKNNRIPSVIALICQFFFCADVISLFVLRIVSKKQSKSSSVFVCEKENEK